MEKDKHLGLRIDSETHGKLKSLAEFEGRSINGEVLYLIRQARKMQLQRQPVSVCRKWPGCLMFQEVPYMES